MPYDTPRKQVKMPRSLSGAISPTYPTIMVAMIPMENPWMSFPVKKTALVVAINSIVIATKATKSAMRSVYRRPIQSAICPVTRHATTFLHTSTLASFPKSNGIRWAPSYEADGAPLNALCHPAGSTYSPDPLGNSNPKSFLNCGMPTTAPDACVSKPTRIMVQHA
jgi:hypothetical protein